MYNWVTHFDCEKGHEGGLSEECPHCRIAELEQQLLALRKWHDTANEVYPVVTAHIDRLLLNQGGE